MTKEFCDACGTEVNPSDYNTPTMTLAYPRMFKKHILCAHCAEPFVALMEECGMLQSKEAAHHA
jgi:hypothetical protein